MHDHRFSCQHSLRPALVGLALLAVWLLGGLTGGFSWGQQQAEDQGPAIRATRGVLIEFTGPITPMLQAYLERKLDRAQQMGADLVIVEINSPGGYLQESLAIAVRLRDLDWAHTVAYVPEQALSGGAIVALGCDEILMQRHAVLGNAGPIFQGEGGLFQHAPEKIRSDLAMRMRSLAEAKGRPTALTEAMVDLDLVVYQVRHRETGQVRYMSEQELRSADDGQQWEKGQPVLESQEGRFLEVTGARAVELGLAEGLVGSRQQLQARYELASELPVLKPTAADRAVYVLNLPLVTSLLLVIGLVALYVEFNAPGIGLGGLMAGLCFALFFWSRFLGGTADWLEIILFVAGLIFIGMELFVFPGFGLPGVAGLLLVLSALILAGQDFVVPTTERQFRTFLTSLLVVSGSGVAFLVAAIALARYYGSLPLVGRLVLQPPTEPPDREQAEGKQGKPTTAVGKSRWGVDVGDFGVADSPLRPAGKARFGDHYVDVVTDGLFVDKGKQVRVIQITGTHVVVREIEDPAVQAS